MYQVRDFQDALSAIEQAHDDEMGALKSRVGELEDEVNFLTGDVVDLEDALAERDAIIKGLK